MRYEADAMHFFVESQLEKIIKHAWLEQAVAVMRIMKEYFVICGKDCNCDCLPNLRSRREAAAIKLLNRIAERPSHPLHDVCPKRSYTSQRFIMPAVKTPRRLNSFFPMSKKNCFKGQKT